jgi:hypothetical protein
VTLTAARELDVVGSPPFGALLLVAVHRAHSIETPITKSPTLDVLMAPDKMMSPAGFRISVVLFPKKAFCEAIFWAVAGPCSAPVPSRWRAQRFAVGVTFSWCSPFVRVHN